MVWHSSSLLDGVCCIASRCRVLADRLTASAAAAVCGRAAAACAHRRSAVARAHQLCRAPSEPGRSASCLETARARITDTTRPDAQASWPCLCVTDTACGAWGVSASPLQRSLRALQSGWGRVTALRRRGLRARCLHASVSRLRSAAAARSCCCPRTTATAVASTATTTRAAMQLTRLHRRSSLCCLCAVLLPLLPEALLLAAPRRLPLHRGVIAARSHAAAPNIPGDSRVPRAVRKLLPMRDLALPQHLEPVCRRPPSHAGAQASPPTRHQLRWTYEERGHARRTPLPTPCHAD